MSLIASETALCAQVAIPLPVADPFTYLIPENLQNDVKPGIRILVPFTNREITGYVTAVEKISTEGRKLKSVLSVMDESVVVSPSVLALTRWVASTYGSSWGEAIENALPKWVKHGKKAQKAIDKMEDIPAEALVPPEEFTLSPDQQSAFQTLSQELREKNPRPALLHGVTGSGKSEVYIRLIRQVLGQNKTAICLVPEIALTEQLKHFFIRHFGDILEILHSKQSDTERFLAWHRLQSGKKRMVLGPRSAVFAPVHDLGLIIIDEEHESSYKQETSPRYHARETALWRAKNEQALLVLGSATPSLETVFKCEKGEFLKLDLKTRIDDKPLPAVQVIDLRNPGGPSRKPQILSHRLIQEIEANLRKKEGTILLLNRRGFSTSITCPRCGAAEQCKSCQVSLTYHQEDNLLLCHYCNFQKPLTSVCSNCKSPLLKFSGFGTEKIESEIARIFPAARTGRLDADTVRKKGSHEIILAEFRNQKMDILIGTQMIAKGFDFPHVTLVGVVLADVGLMLPDFRSAERTFQLLTQVAGRAGRGSLPGRVIIQTFSPDHPSVKFAKDHHYSAFYQNEIQQRYQYQYPPYRRLINIMIRSKNEQKAYQYATEIRDGLKSGLADLIEKPDTLELIGPTPLPFYRLRGQFRWHVMLKHDRLLDLTDRVQTVLQSIKRSTLVQTALDIDPLSIL